MKHELDQSGQVRYARFLGGLVAQAKTLARSEPILDSVLHDIFSTSDSLGGAFARHLTRRIGLTGSISDDLEALFVETYLARPHLNSLAILDLESVLRRDPAAGTALSVFLNQKGFHALQYYRFTHQLWMDRRCDLAMYLQSLMSSVWAVDIHPASQIGHSAMLDHATGIVIGETCVIQDGVSIMQGVTLGGTGKSAGDRHPKIVRGVLIGAGATLLGNITVGNFAKIGAGSVVLTDVPSRVTVAGVPAVPVGAVKDLSPAEEMNQCLSPEPFSPSTSFHYPTGAAQ